MSLQSLVLFLFSLPDHQSAFCIEFTAELETNINTVLCTVQTLVKRRKSEQQKEHQESVKRGENDLLGTCVLPYKVKRLKLEMKKADLSEITGFIRVNSSSGCYVDSVILQMWCYLCLRCSNPVNSVLFFSMVDD